MTTKKLSVLSLIFISGLFMVACGTRFNKSDLKTDATPELSTKQKADFTAIGNQELKDLSAADQDKVTNLLFDYLSSIKWATLGKQFCHAGALGNAACKDKREQCLEKIGDKTDATIQGKFKEKEATIKTELTKVVKTLEVSAEDLVATFDLFDSNMKTFADLDCDASTQTIQAAQTKMKSDAETKFGAAKILKLEEAGEKIFKAMRAIDPNNIDVILFSDSITSSLHLTAFFFF